MRQAVMRQWAVFGMAALLTGTVFFAVVATQNFYTIDRLLASQPNPAFGAAVNKLGAPEARDLLRYLSSELNRLYFQYWNVAQLLFGIFVLWMILKLPNSRGPKWYVVAMLAIGLVLTIVITPQMLYVGRELDFAPHDPQTARLRTFGLLHAAYTLLDAIQMILGIMVMVWLMRGKENENAS